MVLQEVDELLCRLRSSEATSTSSSSIIHKLSGLQDLHDSVNRFLQLPLTQQALAQEQNEKWTNELLDGSLRLLDVCGTALQDLQSIMQRRLGGETEALTSEVWKYLTSRKMVKKAIQKAMKNLKAVDNISTFSSLNKDNESSNSYKEKKKNSKIPLTSRKEAVAAIDWVKKSREAATRPTQAPRLAQCQGCHVANQGMRTGSSIDHAKNARRLVKKAIHKAMINLKGSSFSSLSKDNETIAVVSTSRHIQAVTLSRAMMDPSDHRPVILPLPRAGGSRCSVKPAFRGSLHSRNQVTQSLRSSHRVQLLAWNGWTSR
ncbi:unnamed protein product [Prunus armeniaca]